MNVLSKRDPYMCRTGNGDLSRPLVHGQFKKLKIRSKYPIKVDSDDKEKPKSIKLQKPPELAYSETFEGPKKVHDNADIKNMKAEEKRIYEIENCNISAIAGESLKVVLPKLDEIKLKESEKIEYQKNIFNQGSFFKISNTQRF